jgi:hypothetical protein
MSEICIIYQCMIFLFFIMVIRFFMETWSITKLRHCSPYPMIQICRIYQCMIFLFFIMVIRFFMETCNTYKIQICRIYQCMIFLFFIMVIRFFMEIGNTYNIYVICIIYNIMRDIFILHNGYKIFMETCNI